MSIQVSYKKQFFMTIIGVLIILAVIEGAARFYEYFTPGCRFLDNDAFDKMHPETVKQMCRDVNSLIYENNGILLNKPDQHYPTVNINSHGFRGPEISDEKPDGVYRIFVVGGSTTFGFVSSSDENTIPGFLQKKFNEIELDKKVEVINAGVAGASSFRESYYIKNMLIELEPDLFIIFDGANDVRYRIVEPKENENDNFIEFDPNIFRNYPFYRTPIVVQNLIPKDVWFEIKFPSPTDEIATKVVSSWKNRWVDVCQLGKIEGFSILVTVQPMVGAGNKILTQAELENGIKKNTEWEMKMLEDMANKLSELGAICEGTQDLRYVFDDIKETVFFDQLHTTDFGNEIVAQRLYELSLPVVKNGMT